MCKAMGRKWALVSRVEMMVTWPCGGCASWGEGGDFFFMLVTSKWSLM